MANINVTKLSMGKNYNFPGAEYNENKVEAGVADLLLMENVDASLQHRVTALHQCGINCTSDVEQYLKDHSIACNTNTKRWQFHVAVSVPRRELDKKELKAFARQFMEKIGYGQQPYFVYFHRDTDNNHVHILSTRINEAGFAISDHQDIPFMNHCVNELLHEDIQKDVSNMLSFSFQTMGQFANIVRSCGYQPSAPDTLTEDFIIYRNGTAAYRIPAKNLRQIMALSQHSLQEKRKAREKQLVAIFMKYRKASLSEKADAEKPKKKSGHAKTKKELVARKKKANPDINKLRHANGSLLTDDEKAQMSRFLTDMKTKFGIEIYFQKDKNGVIRGYGIVDRQGKLATDGSKVMALKDLVDFKELLAKKEEKQTRRESKPQGYIPDAMLDVYRQLFTPRMVLLGPDERPGIEITMSDGKQIYHEVSASQLQWWQHGQTEQERNDIAICIAAYAFHKEIYEAYRNQLIAECQKRAKLPEGTSIREVRIRKMRNGSWQIAILFDGQRDIDGFKATLSDDDARLWLQQTDNGSRPNGTLKLQLATKYIISEDMRQIIRHRPYDSYGLSTAPLAATPSMVSQFIPSHIRALSDIRHILTCYGGSQDENREYEVGSHEEYEESIRSSYGY